MRDQTEGRAGGDCGMPGEEEGEEECRGKHIDQISGARTEVAVNAEKPWCEEETINEREGRGGVKITVFIKMLRVVLCLLFIRIEHCVGVPFVFVFFLEYMKVGMCDIRAAPQATKAAHNTVLVEAPASGASCYLKRTGWGWACCETVRRVCSSENFTQLLIYSVGRDHDHQLSWFVAGSCRDFYTAKSREDQKHSTDLYGVWPPVKSSISHSDLNKVLTQSPE